MLSVVSVRISQSEFLLVETKSHETSLVIIRTIHVLLLLLYIYIKKYETFQYIHKFNLTSVTESSLLKGFPVLGRKKELWTVVKGPSCPIRFSLMDIGSGVKGGSRQPD